MELSASPDGKYLAWSEAEGCYDTTIVDLTVLLRDQKAKVVANRTRGLGVWKWRVEGAGPRRCSSQLLTPYVPAKDRPVFVFPHASRITSWMRSRAKLRPCRRRPKFDPVLYGRTGGR